MTSTEINSEITKNIEAIAESTKKRAEYDKGAKEFRDWYNRLIDKRPDVINTAKDYERKRTVEEEKIEALTKRNRALNEQLDSINATALILAKQGKTVTAVEEEAKAKANAVKKASETKAQIELSNQELELQRKKALQQQTEEQARIEANKTNPILKISLIALGVAGVMIGGFLLVKKK